MMMIVYKVDGSQYARCQQENVIVGSWWEVWSVVVINQVTLEPRQKMRLLQVTSEAIECAGG